MGKRPLERSSGELQLRYPYGNKRLRFSRMIYFSDDSAKLLHENNMIDMPYVYINPREEYLGKQANKEDNRLNLKDYFESSSMAVAVWSTKKPMLSICRKALRELQFLKYFEKLGWKSDLITDYCRTSHTDLNTLMKELKLLFFSLKQCNVNVDKIIEQCSKDKKNVKLFFEYLTKYLQSMSIRKPVIVLDRIEIDPNLSQDALKRKVQEILNPDQNKVGKVNIETIDDSDYPKIKRANRRKSYAGIEEDLNVNKPFVPPYNLQQGINKSSTADDKRLGKSLGDLPEAQSGTDEEALSINSEISERPVGTDIDNSCDQSCILKLDEKHKKLPNRKLTPQHIQDDNNHDAEKAESSSGAIQPTDTLKESRIDAGIEENMLSKSSEEVFTSNSQLRKTGIRRTKDTQQNVLLPHTLESTNEPIPSGKRNTTTTNDTIEEKTANESEDSSKNKEILEASTEKREPLISSDSVEINRLRRRNTRRTKDIEGKNILLPLNLEPTSKPTPTGKQITIPTSDISSIEEERAKELGDSSKSSEEVFTSNSQLRKRGIRRTKDTQQNVLLPHTSESTNEPIPSGKRNTTTTNDTIEEKTANESEYSSKNNEILEASTEKREPLISSDSVEINRLRKRNTRRTKDIEEKNILLPLNLEPTSKPTPTGKQITIPTSDISSIEEERAKELGDSSKSSEEVFKSNSQLRKRGIRRTKDTQQNVLLPHTLESTNEPIPSGKRNTATTNDTIEEKTANESEDSSKNNEILEASTEKREPLVSSDSVEINRFRKRNTRRTKDIEEKNILLPLNLEPTSKPTPTEKQITIPTNDISSIEEKRAKELGDSSRNDEGMDVSTKKREPLISNDKVYTKRDCLRKRSARGTKVIESDDDNGMALNLNSDMKCKFFVSENISENTAINGAVVSIKHPVTTISKDNSTEDCEISHTPDTPDLKEIETEDTFIPTENDRSVHKLGDSLKQTEVSKETLQIENVPLINSDECTKINAGNENKDDTETNKGMDSRRRSLADQLKSGKENKHFLDKSQAPKDDENEMGQNVDTESDKNTNVLRDSVESILDGKTDTDNNYFKTNETVGRSTDVDVVRLSQNESERHTSNLREMESLIKNDTINKRIEINKIVEGVKQMELSSNEISNSSQHDQTSKSSYLGEQILEECAASISNIVTPKKFEVSTKSSKETAIVLKPLTVKLNLLTNCLDRYGKIIEMNRRGMCSKVSDCRKADESTESANKYKDLQENISFENSERTKNEEKREDIEVKSTKEFPISLMDGQQSQYEKKTPSFNYPQSFQDSSRVPSRGIKGFDDKRDSVTDKEDSTMKDSPFKRIETNKRSIRVLKRSFDIESLISPDEPKSQTNTFTEEKQFEKNLAEAETYSSSIESTVPLKESDAIIDAGMKEHISKSDEEDTASTRLRKRDIRKTQDTQKNISLSVNLESKNKTTTTGKLTTIAANDTSSIEIETVNESRDPLRNDERIEVDTEKREPLITSDSRESSRLRNRVIIKTKDVQKHITLQLNLESEGKPTPTVRQDTISTNDISFIEEETANEPCDSPRNDERIEVDTEKREPLISCDSTESSRLRKRIPRKTKEIEKNTTLPPNLEPKGKQTPTKIQVAILTDTSSVEEQTANESGASPRNDERMEDDAETREPLISSDSVENSRLRKRVTKKTKDAEKNIHSLNLESKGKPTPTEKQVIIPTNDITSVKEEEVNESGNLLRNDERMEVGTENRDSLINSDGTESSRLRKRVTRKTKEVKDYIIPPPNLESKGKPTPTEKQVTIPTNDTSIEKDTASESGESPRKDERIEVGTEKREPLISSVTAEKSRLRKRVTRKIKEVEEHIILPPNVESKGKPTPTEKQVTISTTDTSFIEKDTASESGVSLRNDERMEVDKEKPELLISSDSTENSRLRKRVTRKTKEVKKNTTLPPHLESKGKPTPTEMQVTISTTDTGSIEKDTASESGISPRNVERMEVDKEKQEPLISSDSAKNSRLRKRVTRKTKEVEKNTILLPHLESKGKPTLPEMQVTIPRNDTSSVEKDMDSESGILPRNVERMEVDKEKQDLLIRSESAENSRLRKRVTRKTKEVEKSIIFPQNSESKGKPTPTEMQVTIPTNDTSYMDKDKASESEDSPRNDERMNTEKGETLISSHSAESSRLRKRDTRKTKDVEKNITSPLNLKSKSKPTPTGKITIPTNDASCIEEETANELEDPCRNDERMDGDTKKQEPPIRSESAESSHLRKMVTRKAKDVEKNITFSQNLESVSKPTRIGKQIIIATNDTSSVPEEEPNESGDLSKNHERLDASTEEREPLISSDNDTKRDCLRKRSTRGIKVVESENDNETALSLNFDRTIKQPVRENISEMTSDIDGNVGDDISKGMNTDENSVDKSTILSSETKAETNDGLKTKLSVDVGVSKTSTDAKIISIKNRGLELVKDLLIEDGTTVKINERRKSSENQRRKDEQLVVKVLRNQGQSATEVDKSKSPKRSRNNVKIERNDENEAVRDLRKDDEEMTETDESERSTRNKNKGKTQSDECDPVKDLRKEQHEGDSKALESVLSKTNELKLLSIRLCDVAEDLRKQDEANAKQLKGSSDNEISKIWCFQTKDTEKRSFDDVDSEMLGVDSQMPSSLYLRLESMDLNKDPMKKTTLCPDFKTNGNSISCLYDTFQEADFSWQCYKLQASTAESPRSITSNQFLSENVDVLQMLKMDDDIENQIFVGNDLSLLEGLNTGLPSLYPVQSTSSVMSPRKVS